MLNIVRKIMELRKARSWSKEDLAKQVKSSRIIIGKYQHNCNLPWIVVLLKMANLIDVSLDFLIGEGY